MQRVAAAFAEVAQDEAVQRRLPAMDRFPGHLGPDGFRAFIADALGRWQAITDRLGLQADG